MKSLVILVVVAIMQGTCENGQIKMVFPDDNEFQTQRGGTYQTDVKNTGIKKPQGGYGTQGVKSSYGFPLTQSGGSTNYGIKTIPPGVKTNVNSRNWPPSVNYPKKEYTHGNPQIDRQPHGGHPFGGHQFGGHPFGGHQFGGHPFGGHPHGDHPHGYGHPHGDHPQGYGELPNNNWRLPPQPGSVQTELNVEDSSKEYSSNENWNLKFATKSNSRYPNSNIQQETRTFLHSQQLPTIGGCSSFKAVPANSFVKCQNATKTCRVNCQKGFKFPTGSTSLQISCVNDMWIIKDSEWNVIPSCEPVCIPACMNNGICIEPGLCRCPQNFHGPYCQHRKILCQSYPPVPHNSNMNCNSTVCTIQCMKGYKFGDGSQITNMMCEDGQWVHTKLRKTSVPNCNPICDPPCQNEGTCQAHNSCSCLKKYRGPLCEFDENRCNLTRLGFNGIFSCVFKQNEVICKVQCPSPIEFEFPPVPEYVCRYNEDKFFPNMPNCVYPPGVKIIRGEDLSYKVSEVGVKHSTKYGEPKSQVEILSELPFANFKSQTNGTYALYLASDLNMKTPEPSMCATWGRQNVKTFDGLIYKTPLHCSHTLVEDKIDRLFKIIFRACPYGASESCQHSLHIFYNDVMYTLSTEGGDVTLRSPKKKFPIPVQLLGMKVFPVAQFIKIDLDKLGLAVYWDKDQYVVVEASGKLWDRVHGLCGTMDMDPTNDMVTKTGTKVESLKSFVDAWEVQPQNSKEECSMANKLEFENPQCDINIQRKGFELCKRILSDEKLANCIQKLNSKILIASCVEDYCNCANKENRYLCVCETVSTLAKDCIFKGNKLVHGWRNLEICPVHCEKGRIYSACGSAVEPTCGSETNIPKEVCQEGCFCPEGTVQYKGNCIFPEQCPCTIRNKEFKTGSKITKDCNTCTCEAGTWKCTDKTCGARCGAIGDPHYSTFDGKRYDFMGKCSYTLFKTDELDVETENVACPGSISAAMDLPVSTSTELPSCTKSVTIKIPLNDKKYSIKLAQGPVIYVNDKEVEKYPKTLGNNVLVLRQASSTFVSVDFANGIRIWWDGNTRVYVDVPASYQNKTQGLCGTFNFNSEDDFLTPEGDVENAVEPFADKWKTQDTCDFLSDSPTPYPCDMYPENREKAEKYCEYILSDVFEECHWSVDPETFYENCIYDVCACKNDISTCLCPILAAYGTECSRQGVNTNWRFGVKECSLQCPAGQVYDECGDGCIRKCEDLARKDTCKGNCIEGCRCPLGEYLNDKNECIPEEKCPCWYDGISFESNYKEVRPEQNSLQLCTCTKGLWECVEASPEDNLRYPPSSGLKIQCLSRPNSEFSSCVPEEPKTCKNMHVYSDNFEDCKPGCLCQIGYVLDAPLNKCVLPQDCSCHHAGRSYNDGDEIQADCNNCICKSGKWECTTHKCASTCSVWGDSHFTTFDKKEFDFQGACDYVLSKGADTNGDGFTITIQNVLCGSLGVTCSKSVKISLTGSLKASLTLSSDPSDQKSIEKYKKIEGESLHSFTVYETGLFIVVEVLDLGLQVKWDRGTRVYVKLNDKWKQKVRGLCGNYNDDSQDDMMSPSMGLETSPILFGHSWKLQDYCSMPTEPINVCKEHPERESWAHLKCGILKSSLFKECHNKVPYEKYLKRCVFDTCACDQGGDCECLCTALAAYAYACSLKGTNIKWRTPNLCPMQCDPTCSEYRSCTQPCPVETCDNFLEQGVAERMCLTETCFEGCHIKPCDGDMIYLNDSFTECVPKNTCKPICMEKDGIVYYEGDITRLDSCQTCRCTRKKEICSGAPCTSSFPISSTPLVILSTTAKPLETCDPTIPHREIPGDCYKFHHCSMQPDGIWTNVEKTCGPSMMYNPISMTCDHVSSVIIIKPNCSLPKLTSPTPSTHAPIMSQPCGANETYTESPKDCANYFVCEEIGKNIWSYVEKSCPDSKLFNPLIKKCDNAQSVIIIKPSCQFIPHYTTASPLQCPPGKRWSECAITCDKTCDYYKKLLHQRGLCQMGDVCAEGCVSTDVMTDCISPDKYWRDENTCVLKNECPCMTSDGKLVKPHDVYESIQNDKPKICQCLDNQLICLPEKPKTIIPSEKSPKTTTEGPIIIPITVTPPKACEEKDMIPIITGPYGVPDTAFAASSVLGSSFLPQYARLHSKPSTKSNGSWSPANNDPSEYLQITLPQALPLYGVVVQGSPIFDQYVELYQVSYSFDGGIYHYILDENKLPQIFRGPESSRQTKSSIFSVPIEAKVVRLHPLKWHGAVAMRVELYGCSTTTPSVTDFKFDTTTPVNMFDVVSILPSTKFPTDKTTVEIVCDDEMGVNNQKLNPNQVRASSVLWPKPVKGKKPRLFDMLKMSSPIGWRPAVDTPNQFVLFDFLEPRNITGIKTKGGPDGCVTAYKVMFSKNGKLWNKVLTPDGLLQIFEGNLDSDTPKTNYFQYPIQAQMLKVVPVEWQDAINMRIEPIGCFHPYPETTSLPEQEPSVCPICPEVETNMLPMDDNCKCKEPLYWDGKGNCVEINLCPCIVNHLSYSVGSIYENQNCEECVCVLGGISQCTEKKCPPCTLGLRRDKSKPCTCLCEPCPQFQRICPSSGDCIPEDLWCNGYQDCEDDEIDCIKVTTVAPVTPTQEIFTNKSCPTPACPDGMEVQLTGIAREREMSEMFDTSQLAIKGPSPVKTKKIYYQMSVDIPDEQVESISPIKCPEYICAFVQNNNTISCPLPQCQEGYEPEFEKSKDYGGNQCVPYTCNTVRQKDDICKVSGKTLKTFDGTEFKFDLCNHILARDLIEANWAVILNVNCTNYQSCKRKVVIKDKVNDFSLTLLPDLTVNLNGFDFTVRQLEKTSAQFGFIISQPGNTILFVSKKHGLWVSYCDNEDVKIGISSRYIKTVDGLCGYYNNNPVDDKRLPNGHPAKNTVEFGEAWFSDDVSKTACQPDICTEDPKLALDICNSIKHEVFSPCSKVMDYDGFISNCVEATCQCLKEEQNSTGKQLRCKCLLLDRFVKDCLAGDPEVQLDTWRAISDCEIACPSPLIYKDCYKRRCEPSCDTIGKTECPLLSDECFSGCFCPDGTVRKGDSCVSPTECKDCVCDGIGKSKYVTYDRNNFTFDGNCTYLLSRDISVLDTHTFQVYVSMSPCENSGTKSIFSKSSCAHSLHILYGEHIIHLQRLPENSIQIFIDGLPAKTLPFKKNWLYISKNGGEIVISLPESQVDITSDFSQNSFSIRVPSIKYASKLEGLCGNCNGDPNDDLLPNPKYTKEVKGNTVADIAKTWVADNLKLGLGTQECISEDVVLNDCIVPDPEVDPCLKIFDEKLFGNCHFVVDPIMYVSACQQDMCKHGSDQKGACESLSAYAKECLRNGICLNWRNAAFCEYDCPLHLHYEPCGCSETCNTATEVFDMIDVRSLKEETNDQACSTDRYEGCFCPKGKVLLNNKCVLEKECTLCDDDNHYPGDEWFKDKCTECTCNRLGKVECTKKECSVQERVCTEGFYALKTSSEDECCPKFICVPEPTVPPSLTCPDAPPLVCGPGQNRKILTAKNGCPQFVCECKPLSECEPLRPQRPLGPGEKLVTETIGCCPSQKIVCDKQQCPPKPTKCDNELYEIVKDTKDDECCSTYKCAAPKNTCLVTIDGKQTLKRFGDKWSIPNDPCVQKVCSFGPEGLLIEIEQQEMCDLTCEKGFKYSVDPGRCCGKCVQIMCNLGGQLYKPGEVWYSHDNCTKFKCDEIANQLSISSYEETCPDVTDCPENSRYKKGCCIICMPKVEAQMNCLPESLAESETTGLIQIFQPSHGLCTNKEPIREFTECHGSCSSGSKFNKWTYGQDKICECCSVKAFNELTVSLTCDDGYKTYKTIQIPSSCGCSPCEAEAKISQSSHILSGVKTVKG